MNQNGPGGARMINQTMDKAGVAKALGQSVRQFEENLPALSGLGFPPAAGEDDAWHVADLLDWVTRQQEAHLQFVETVAAFLQNAAD